MDDMEHNFICMLNCFNVYYTCTVCLIDSFNLYILWAIEPEIKTSSILNLQS